MKPVDPVTTAATSGRRAQPVRQTRIKPPRASATGGQTVTTSRGSGSGFDASHQVGSSHGFFPALTHFTDCISALPKEVVRHFTLLKEVDAKAYGPENTLRELTDMAMQTADPKRKEGPSVHHVHKASPVRYEIPMLFGHVTGCDTYAEHYPKYLPDSAPSQADDDRADLARRQLFFNLRFVLNEMLMTVDEKNHVVSTANDALHKQLVRIDGCFPYIDNEISEEARLGSLAHWAYTEKPNGRANGTTSERPRRDLTAAGSVAATLAAMTEDGTMTRSESRREMMLARKQRNQVGDSGAGEGQSGRQRDILAAHPTAAGIQSKKGNGNSRSRKVAEIYSIAVGPTTPNSTSSTGNPPNKRRKVEKLVPPRAPVTREATDRTIADPVDSTIASAKGDAGSPRLTPAVEGPKRRARNGGAGPTGQIRKRNTNTSAAQSPALASSPVAGSFPLPKDIPDGSPAPSAGPRPGTGRGRQSSAQSIAQEAKFNPTVTLTSNPRHRPSSSSLNRNNNHASPEAAETDIGPGVSEHTASEAKSHPKASTKPEREASMEQKGSRGNGDSKGGGPSANKAKESLERSERSVKREDTESNSAQNSQQGNAGPTSTSTRGGSKSSKTSTPVSSTFPESHRPRSSRIADTTVKRSHKKGAGSGAATQQATAASSSRAAEDELSSMQGDEEHEADGSEEPRYCYCNQVSYGSMVACDSDTCPLEWFHLHCVGLAKPPGKNEVWFCDRCKETLRRKVNGNGAAR